MVHQGPANIWGGGVGTETLEKQFAGKIRGKNSLAILLKIRQTKIKNQPKSAVRSLGINKFQGKETHPETTHP